MNSVKYYYNNWKFQYYILRYLYNREFAVLPSKIENNNARPVRNLRVHNIQHFQFMMKRLSMFEYGRIYNLYYSLAEFEGGIPYQDLTSLKRDNEEWNKEHIGHIKAYDFVLDVDSGNHEKEEIDMCIYSAKSIKRFFDSVCCPYYIRFSGMGFHFIIPYRFFPKIYSLNPNEKTNIYSLYRKIAKYIYDKYSEMVDYEIFDTRRIIKIPYSLSIYDSGIFVCKPVNNIDDFGLYKYENNEYFVNEQLNNIKGNVERLINNIA